MIILNTNAQNKQREISEKDRRGIQERAWLLAKEYEILLSQISNSSMYPQEVLLIIKNSYTGGTSRLFEDEKVIIEEDLFPEQINLERPKNVNVKTYLKRFDLIYKDTDKQSVFFKNITVTDVNIKDYVYVQVVFDCEFLSKNKLKPNAKFKNYKRIVEIRAFNTTGIWNGYITYVGFYNPYKSLKSSPKENHEILNKNKKTGQNQLTEVQKPLPIIFNSKKYIPEKLSIENILDKKANSNKAKLEINLDNQINKILVTNDYNGASVVAQQNIDLYLTKYKEAKINNDEKEQAIINNIISYSYLWKSYISILQDNFKHAIVEANKGLVYNIDYADLYYVNGISNAKLGAIGEAKKNLTRAIKIQPDYSKAYILLSKIHLKKKKDKEATKILNTYITKFGEYNANILLEKAIISEANKDYIKAEINFKKAFKLEPSNIKTAIKAAEMSLKQKKYADTISYLNSQKDKNRSFNKSALYHAMLGEIYYKIDNKKEAITHLSKAIDLKDKTPSTYLNLISIEKNINKAIKILEQALKDKILDKSHLTQIPDKIKKKASYQKLIDTYL